MRAAAEAVSKAESAERRCMYNYKWQCHRRLEHCPRETRVKIVS